MTPSRGLSALAVCLSLATGCSDADDNDCPIHIDAPVDAFAFPDAPAVDAPTIDAPIDAVFDTLPPLDAPSGPPPSHVQMLRAVRALTLLEGRLDDYLQNGFFPTLNIGFTPGATCCGAGGVTLCPDNPAGWQSTAWAQLDFSITGSHAHVYQLQSTGTELTAVARADLDCDGTPADVTLHCTRDAAGTHCEMTWPDFLE